MRQSFTTWLLEQTGRDDPVGDLAGDVARDPDWPASGRGLRRLVLHLQACGACPGALEALKQAWNEWRQEVAREQVLP